MRHIAPENDWIYREMAQGALMLAQGWDSPLTRFYRDSQVFAHLEGLLEALVKAGADGRWWSRQPDRGDANVDRFTLMPLCEVVLRVRSRLEPGLERRLTDVIEKGAAYQVESYAHARARMAGEYPNMDAYFMVLIELAAMLLDRADYHRLALDFLGSMETCLLPDGGFIYYKGTNECEIYHQINVIMLIRLWELTYSARVLDLIKRTLPYYPNAAEPSGVVEYYSDPFWKHTWSPMDPALLDMLATLFPGDVLAAQHRWLARRLHDAGVVSTAAGAAIDYWMDEPGEPLPDRVVRYDGSVRGPRGRFGAFSWGGTTGDTMDSFVGAMVSHRPGVVSALQAAGVEILLDQPVVPGDLHHERHARCAYVSGRRYFSRQIVAEDRAALVVDSPIYTGVIPWEEHSRDCGWHTRQVWLMTPERLVGLITLRRDRPETSARRVTAYFRFGGREMTHLKEVYRCGEMALRVAEHDFAEIAVAPAYQFFLDRDAVSSEVRFSADPADGREEYRLLVEILPLEVAPAAVALVTDGSLGFTVGEGERNTRVMAHLGPQPIAMPCFEGEGVRWYEGRAIGCLQRAMARPLPGELSPGALVLIES